VIEENAFMNIGAMGADKMALFADAAVFRFLMFAASGTDPGGHLTPHVSQKTEACKGKFRQWPGRLLLPDLKGEGHHRTMEACGGLFVAVLMLVGVLVLVLRKLIPRGVLAHTAGDLIRNVIKAVWHFIFGAPHVRIQRRRRFWRRGP
jgi:hypothetical protein